MYKYNRFKIVWKQDKHITHNINIRINNLNIDEK